MVVQALMTGPTSVRSKNTGKFSAKLFCILAEIVKNADFGKIHNLRNKLQIMAISPKFLKEGCLSNCPTSGTHEGVLEVVD